MSRGSNNVVEVVVLLVGMVTMAMVTAVVPMVMVVLVVVVAVLSLLRGQGNHKGRKRNEWTANVGNFIACGHKMCLARGQG